MFELDKITRNGVPSNGSAQKDTPLREASKPLMLQGKMWVIARFASCGCELVREPGLNRRAPLIPQIGQEAPIRDKRSPPQAAGYFRREPGGGSPVASS